MNDKQVGGKYADTDVSNLILVSAYMEALGVKKVIPKDINLSDGVLVMPDYWPNIEKKTAH
jgi:exopolyphosphatase/guanosine-5'-triphosphate,3'-diphosphate pyrophosphatase